MDDSVNEGLDVNTHDPLLRVLNRIVIWSVKGLAVMMVFVIIWAFIDVLVHISVQMFTSFESIFSVDTLFSIIGSILLFLIAIEVYLNIVFFLKSDSINVPLVLATALTAISRKVIILDYTATSNMHIIAMAFLVFTVGVNYWLITRKNNHGFFSSPEKG